MRISFGEKVFPTIYRAMTVNRELGGTFLVSAKFSGDLMRRGHVTHAEAL